MHNGRYGVRHFTTEKSCFSHSGIKGRCEKFFMVQENIFDYSISKSKVLGIYHTETPLKKCENK